MAALNGETVNLQGVAATVALIGSAQRSDTVDLTGENIGFIVLGGGNGTVQFETLLGDQITLTGLTPGFRLECIVRKIMTGSGSDVLLMKIRN